MELPEIEPLGESDSQLEKMRKTGRNLGVHGLGIGLRAPIAKVFATATMPTEDIARDTLGIPAGGAQTPGGQFARDIATRFAGAANMILGAPTWLSTMPSYKNVMSKHPYAPQNTLNRIYSTGLRGPAMTETEWYSPSNLRRPEDGLR